MESTSARQRSIANRKLIRILSIGFCISLILHIIAIAGISYVSIINTEEEMEIATIERVELEPEPAPSISKSTSTSSAIPAKTAFNTSEKSNSTQFTTTTPKTPQSQPQQSNGLPSATAIDTKNSQRTLAQNTSDRQNNSSNSNKQPDGNNPNSKQQVESRSNSTKKSDINTNLGNSDSSNNATTNKSSNQSTSVNNNITPIIPNGTNSNSNTKPNGSSSDSNNNSQPNSSSPPGNKKSQAATQCLRNCTIKYPDEFQDSDVGKGKISIRVTIDGNGLVSTAEIVRSSDNQQLDSFALAAVKKMQFNATGETRIRRIKVNTITNN